MSHFNAKVVLSVAIAAFAVGGVATLSGCASTPKEESAGQYLDSSAVTVKIKSELLADKQVRSLPITVKTYKGHVELSGFVDNAAQKHHAVQIARNVPGVRSVTDALVIKPQH